ncbi:MAG TPA: peptidoglycan-associated lipoprotein Pal [Burkholderiales bacterium]|nr:peptidoglycan-associated lipoprotein Pal [Burkholderiales bacterium]
MGLPDGRETTGGVQAAESRRSVYYGFEKYDVRPEYHALVQQHARWLRENPQARLIIAGNTDERGTSEYNLALGQRRAESVTRMLVLMGARPEQVEAISFGKEKPRAAGHDEASWTENRRSDFARP